MDGYGRKVKVPFFKKTTTEDGVVFFFAICSLIMAVVLYCLMKYYYFPKCPTPAAGTAVTDLSYYYRGLLFTIGGNVVAAFGLFILWLFGKQRTSSSEGTTTNSAFYGILGLIQAGLSGGGMYYLVSIYLNTLRNSAGKICAGQSATAVANQISSGNNVSIASLVSGSLGAISGLAWAYAGFGSYF